MGYDTKFYLKAKPIVDENDLLVSVLGEKPRSDGVRYLRRLREIVGYSPLGGDGNKWYEYEENMKTLSTDFPNVLFSLEGVGEDRGDHWTMYFRRGESFRAPAIVTFAPPPAHFNTP